MITAALVFAGLAGLLHVYIWVLEAFLWTTPRGRATFGTSVEEATATRELAYNQGFYNLFLAVVTAAGIVAVVSGWRAVGLALVFAGIGSMLAAALVLLLSSPDKARAAITQGTLPLIGVALLVIGLMI